MDKAKRIVKRGLIAVVLLALAGVAIAAGGTAYVFRRSMPHYTGTAKMPGLSAKVEIYRDTYGVPHIFAANWNDAARALGYVHASERLFQMEMQRRAGQGRLSEILGPSTLPVDELTRTLGLYKLAQSSFAAMTPDAQSYFRAYADGVNDWLKTHRDNLPPEFLLLHDTPEPWKPADSVVWGKLMALELSHNYHLELLRAELAARVPQNIMQWLFPAATDSPVTTKPGAPIAKAAHHADRKLAMLLGLEHAASNEWVIGGSRTKSGKPLLANDPHLGLEAPILWYLARIVTPQDSVEGATVPGLPVVLLGQTDHVAWGFTTTDSDVQDLFLEKPDDGNPDLYLTPNGTAPFVTHNEIIHVKGQADVTMSVRTTRHGPVLSDIDGEMAAVAWPNRVMALAFTGLGAQDTTSEAVVYMDRAQNATQFLDAIKKYYQTPTQNIVYADDKGTFGYINPGLVPIRKSGDGLMPVDGASGKYDWVGTVPFDKLPHVENPAAGYIFNANNAVVSPDSHVYLGQEWEEDYRARRLQQFFDQPGKFTLA
ncbi:MAG: penicillin acylase family protein, partial [Alphaproteobacteria bacterium]|nr:penicillin acylase family protein [Alphaproteobacteria bacterium]